MPNRQTKFEWKFWLFILIYYSVLIWFTISWLIPTLIKDTTYFVNAIKGII